MATMGNGPYWLLVPGSRSAHLRVVVNRPGTAYTGGAAPNAAPTGYLR